MSSIVSGNNYGGNIDKINKTQTHIKSLEEKKELNTQKKEKSELIIKDKNNVSKLEDKNLIGDSKPINSPSSVSFKALGTDSDLLKMLKSCKTFTIKDVTNTKFHDLLPQIKDNGKADIVIKDPSNNKKYLISGDKINLSEIKNALMKTDPEQCERDMRNLRYLSEDGFITEKSMRLGFADAFLQAHEDFFGNSPSLLQRIAMYKSYKTDDYPNTRDRIEGAK